MRVVAGAAPEPGVAVAGAGALGELLSVADHFEVACRCAGRHGIMKDSEGVLKTLPRHEIAETFPWIWYASRAKQMALLANAVSRSGFKFRRIHDGSGTGIGQMAFHWSMAAFAADGFIRKNGRTERIQSAGDVESLARVTQEAVFPDGAREIWIRGVLVAGCEIVGLPAFVKGDGRLK